VKPEGLRTGMKDRGLKMRNRMMGMVVLLLVTVLCFSFTSKEAVGPNPVKTTEIKMLQADSLSFNKDLNPDVNIARGNVIFLHDSIYMYCDSAYLYKTNNMLEAFDNVKIQQGDSLFIYGDYLIYEGNIHLAKMRNNVKMEHGYNTLFTDSFNYDRTANIAYYFDGGMLVDSLNELTSVYGQYLPDIRQAWFRKDVKLINNTMTLYSDTLVYWTETKIAHIVGPSIVESDSGYIHSNAGWYNTKTNDSRLYERSTVFSKDGNKTLTADTLFYNSKTGFGEAFHNMFLQDTAQKVILTGHYGWYDDLKGNAMATDSAQCVEYSQGDSLFLHADTLMMLTLEKNEREMKAYHGTRFYKSNLQGVCDSLQFNTLKSILYMFTDPVLWNSGYQLSGDTIHIYFNDSTIDHIHVFEHPFAIEKIDTAEHYNQLKGNNLKAHFEAGELRNIEVDGNAETIFYPLENDSSFIGMNRTESGFFSMWLVNRKLEKMKIWSQPKGSTTPLPELMPETKFLKDFKILEYLRPSQKEDIFLQVKRKEEDEAPQRNSKFIY
jgi:lipopolysaccharide export system protein LptA